ncbi:guanine nucleotide binding protein, alpha subunit [Blyttiomyces helicus]|uniref:Guanine nucleotide binding protein, alpha subunit n=1 Tax=Blyttiomyces helicus TaxID=388810 RepID=A0A4P9WSN5_9FUNG|nr:guanine nucleotide binding protein, alpha subunit [Blyttiomyces helicus]|eukprot:RKO94036.1 guanine nucleotide binding protein, alpha subunit [Blyttiomyces helicus]
MADSMDSPSQRREARRINDAINAELKKEKAAAASLRGPKILLLGSADSGKTTVLKQMKILHGDGFSMDERLAFRHRIMDNILDSMRALIDALNYLDIDWGEKENEELGKIVKASVERVLDGSLPPEVVKAIRTLWKDGGIQACYKRSNEFFIQDTADYFLGNISKFTTKDYVPTDEGFLSEVEGGDILRTRFRTTSITETRFKIDRFIYRMYDVGGQRSDRLCWAPFFESEIHAILFIVSLASYDQMLVEDPTINRMLDALVLFETVSNNPLLKKVNIILFLNKADLFERKLKQTSVKRYFPDYDGGNDVKSAAKYFRKKFQDQNKTPEKKVYTHFTTGTDTSNMKAVIAAVRYIPVPFLTTG